MILSTLISISCISWSVVPRLNQSKGWQTVPAYICMHAFVFVICVYVCVYMRVHVCVFRDTLVCVRVYVCMRVCESLHVCLELCLCVCVCVFV
jgi:hypothetical protein